MYFRQLNVQKWSERSVVFTFRLRNMLPELRAVFQHLNFQEWSKSGVFTCFYHFDFDMCFAPQQRALFRHLNFREWGVLYVLPLTCARTTAACAFWHLNVQRCCEPGPFCAFCFHKMCFVLASHPTRWLRTRRFSEPTFRSSGNRSKTQCFATFPPFRAP